MALFACSCVGPHPATQAQPTAQQAPSEPESGEAPESSEDSEEVDATSETPMGAGAGSANNERDAEDYIYNDVTALMEHRLTITHVDIIDMTSQFKITSLDSESVAMLRDSMVNVDDITQEEPPWDVGLAIYSSELDYALRARPIGKDRLRLHPTRGWVSGLSGEDLGPGSGGREVEVNPRLFVALGRRVRGAKVPAKDTQLIPRFDWNPYQGDPYPIGPRRVMKRR
jgi:hypothetical protein